MRQKRTDGQGLRRAARAGLVLLLAGAVAGCAASGGATEAPEPDAAAAAMNERFDGLVPVEDARVAMAYVDPEADFSVFRRVKILTPHVAFRSNWQRDQNRGSGTRVRAGDMERIKSDVAALFEQVFTERLQADDGYEVVDEADYDVLLLRPAIIDLDISAPDTRQAGRSSTFTTGSGAATLYIELFDSVTGDLLGRAADRQTARNPGSRLQWSNRVTNSADARRMMRRWADQLRSFLDAHYSAK